VDSGGGGLDQELQLAAALADANTVKPGQVENVLDGATGSVIRHWGLP
jgi:hypothetical protein